MPYPLESRKTPYVVRVATGYTLQKLYPGNGEQLAGLSVSRRKLQVTKATTHAILNVFSGTYKTKHPFLN